MKRRIALATALAAGLVGASHATAVGTESFETYSPGTYANTALTNGDFRLYAHTVAGAYSSQAEIVNNSSDATDGDQFVRLTSTDSAHLGYANLTDLTGTTIDNYRLQFDIRWSGFDYINQENPAQGGWEFDTGPVGIYMSAVADPNAPALPPGNWHNQLRWSTNGQSAHYSSGAGFDWGGMLQPDEWYRYTIDYSAEVGGDGLDIALSIHHVLTDTLISSLAGHIDGPADGGPDWSVYNKGIHTEIWGFRQAVVDLDNISSGVIPEPATLALAGLGGLLALRRRVDR